MREATPSMSATPTRNYEPAPVASGSASIGKAVMVKGQIYSREDLYIDGEVEGNVELADHRLTVGPNGKVKAGIKAREIVALGNIQGNVEASDKVEIRKDARLIGDIKTARIVIEDGAYFKGGIDIVRSDGKQASSAGRPAAAAHPATAAQPAAAAPAAQPPLGVQPQPVGVASDNKH
ncbi:MAG TPA: polymer-forming cytoskeletal protein [Bryobacteraceae bacterium]|nr:polymer-forming cytoskeletal protein [Bryobacteraceae bacterium]